MEAARYCKAEIPVWPYLEHKSQDSKAKEKKKCSKNKYSEEKVSAASSL